MDLSTIKSIKQIWFWIVSCGKRSLATTRIRTQILSNHNDAICTKQRYPRERNRKKQSLCRWKPNFNHSEPKRVSREALSKETASPKSTPSKKMPHNATHTATPTTTHTATDLRRNHKSLNKSSTDEMQCVNKSLNASNHLQFSQNTHMCQKSIFIMSQKFISRTSCLTNILVSSWTLPHRVRRKSMHPPALSLHRQPHTRCLLYTCIMLLYWFKIRLFWLIDTWGSFDRDVGFFWQTCAGIAKV